MNLTNKQNVQKERKQKDCKEPRKRGSVKKQIEDNNPASSWERLLPSENELVEFFTKLK